MKKLLVLALVLGMASFANAGIQISVGGAVVTDAAIDIQVDDVITIGIWNAGGSLPVDFLSYLDIADNTLGLYSLSGLAAGSAIGNGDPAPSFGLNNYAGYDEVDMSQTWASGATELVGNMVTVNLTGLAMGAVNVSLWDDRLGYDNSVQDLTINIVPEPITMALLGLGGLFLRRRK